MPQCLQYAINHCKKGNAQRALPRHRGSHCPETLRRMPNIVLRNDVVETDNYPSLRRGLQCPKRWWLQRYKYGK